MISVKEKHYLRDLAKELSELSMTHENDQKRKNWFKINDLENGSRPVFINHYWPLALNEIFPKDSYVCEDPKACEYENYIKTRIFYAKELKDDNVMEPLIYSNVAFQMEDYEGLQRLIRRSDSDIGDSGAYEMIPVITENDDIKKILLPKISYDEKKTRENYEETYEIFDPILKVISKRDINYRRAI